MRSSGSEAATASCCGLAGFRFRLLSSANLQGIIGGRAMWGQEKTR